MARSLNKATLLGNVVKDAIQKQTPTGSFYTLFTVATNRSWQKGSGEKAVESEFHRIICWDKLAELCGKYCMKGRGVYVEGRLTNRRFTDDSGLEKHITEIVATDVIFLDQKGGETKHGSTINDTGAVS